MGHQGNNDAASWRKIALNWSERAMSVHICRLFSTYVVTLRAQIQIFSLHGMLKSMHHRKACNSKNRSLFGAQAKKSFKIHKKGKTFYFIASFVHCNVSPVTRKMCFSRPTATRITMPGAKAWGYGPALGGGAPPRFFHLLTPRLQVRLG